MIKLLITILILLNASIVYAETMNNGENGILNDSDSLSSHIKFNKDKVIAYAKTHFKYNLELREIKKWQGVNATGTPQNDTDILKFLILFETITKQENSPALIYHNYDVNPDSFTIPQDNLLVLIYLNYDVNSASFTFPRSRKASEKILDILTNMKEKRVESKDGPLTTHMRSAMGWVFGKSRQERNSMTFSYAPQGEIFQYKFKILNEGWKRGKLLLEISLYVNRKGDVIHHQITGFINSDI